VNTALVKQDLLNSLRADPEYRHAWNSENVYTGICFQIRALREQRGWSQAALGKAARMAQERISILEDPNADTKPTLSTLLRIGDALDVGLDVRFVPYGTVIARSTQTSVEDLEVPSFDEELPDLEREFAYEAHTEGFMQGSLVNATKFSGIDVPVHTAFVGYENSMLSEYQEPLSKQVTYLTKQATSNLDYERTTGQVVYSWSRQTETVISWQKSEVEARVN
jgi:transcriptional regulator with XRE-family HTH domain